jgi:ribosome-binding protein aMBF1 (putative translation factor)
MAKKWSELVARIPAERREGIARRTEELVREMPLAELRNARQLTQEHLAKLLRKDQSAISKIERRADMYVSTLADFVRAMGGDLEIRAVFPDGVVNISQFAAIDRDTA